MEERVSEIGRKPQGRPVWRFYGSHRRFTPSPRFRRRFGSDPSPPRLELDGCADAGAGPLAGLYGATFAGFFAALFGGTPAQVTGPTGPMTVVAATLFSTFTSDPSIAFSVVVLAVRSLTLTPCITPDHSRAFFKSSWEL